MMSRVGKKIAPKKTSMGLLLTQTIPALTYPSTSVLHMLQLPKGRPKKTLIMMGGLVH